MASELPTNASWLPEFRVRGLPKSSASASATPWKSSPASAAESTSAVNELQRDGVFFSSESKAKGKGKEREIVNQPQPPLIDLVDLEEKPGIIRISEEQYDDVLKRNRKAALHYIDADDGENIEVGSSLELKERLAEPYLRHEPNDPFDLYNPPQMHEFDINPSQDVVQIWQEQHRRSNKQKVAATKQGSQTTSARSMPDPPNYHFFDSIVQDSSSHSPKLIDPIPLQTRPKTQKYENRWASYQSLPGQMNAKPAPLQVQPEKEPAMLETLQPIPYEGHVAKAQETETNKEAGSTSKSSHQPLLEMFEVELQKLMAPNPAAQAPTVEASIPTNTRGPQELPREAPNPPDTSPTSQPERSSQRQTNINAGEIFANSLRSLLGGFKDLATSVVHQNEDLRHRVSGAHEELSQNLENYLRLSANAIDQFNESMIGSNSGGTRSVNGQNSAISTAENTTTVANSAASRQREAEAEASNLSSKEASSSKGRGTQTSGLRKPVDFELSINYVDKIKERFTSEPEKYKQFLEILQNYQREGKSISEVYIQVAALFKDQPDLLEGFKQFLPETSAVMNENTKKYSSGLKLTTTPTEFQAEQIVGRRFIYYDNPVGPKITQYLVRWSGHDMSQDVWYDVENLKDCYSLVEAYEALYPQNHDPKIGYNSKSYLDIISNLHHRTAGDKMVTTKSRFGTESPIATAKPTTSSSSVSGSLSRSRSTGSNGKPLDGIKSGNPNSSRSYSEDTETTPRRPSVSLNDILNPSESQSARNQPQSSGYRPLRHRQSWHPSSTTRQEPSTFMFNPASVMAKYPTVSQLERNSQALTSSNARPPATSSSSAKGPSAPPPKTNPASHIKQETVASATNTIGGETSKAEKRVSFAESREAVQAPPPPNTLRRARSLAFDHEQPSSTDGRHNHASRLHGPLNSGLPPPPNFPPPPRRANTTRERASPWTNTPQPTMNARRRSWLDRAHADVNQQNVIRTCERQLRHLGFSESQSSTMAQNAEGNLDKALDMLEEDRAAWEDRRSERSNGWTARANNPWHHYQPPMPGSFFPF